MLVGSTALALVLAAQSPLIGDPHAIERPRAPVHREDGMPLVEEVDCREAEVFGGTKVERAALCHARAGKHASARQLADDALRQDPRSFRAHYLMGLAQHHGEGNLPKALYHLQTAEKLFIEQYGERPSPELLDANVYHKTLQQLVYAHGEMDHHEEKIRYVDAISERLGVNDAVPLKAWPLLKLKRFEEAREIAKQAAESDDYWYRAVGATALCAVESELRNRDAAYAACRAAAEPVMRSEIDGAIELSNAGAAAEEMFAFDEAERLFLEATKRIPEGSVNPWGRLVRLYIRQGRFAEAVDAWREMRAYRNRRPLTYLDQQDQAEADLTGAQVLIVAGHEKDALKITERTVKRPDRQGTSSAASEQNEAGAAIMDMVVRRTVARLLLEEASSAELWDSIELRAKAMKLFFEAWVLERKAAEIASDRERLVTSLRPECPGSIEMPAWLDGELVHIVGPGVALAAIAEGRKEETLPPELADQVFLSLEAEAHLADGDEELALEKAKRAMELMPPFEVLLRARMAAIAAEAARRLGSADEALVNYRLALAGDPGVIRRLGFTLPVQLAAADDSPAVKEAIDMLEGSPRLEVGDWGFVLQVGEEVAVLGEEDGSQLYVIRIPEGRKDSTEAIARRIARAIHFDLLVANVDITQADIRSLDGSLGSGGKASDHVKSILDEILEQGPEEPGRPEEPGLPPAPGP
jgi:pentatricopeptide repeat protein